MEILQVLRIFKSSRGALPLPVTGQGSTPLLTNFVIYPLCFTAYTFCDVTSQLFSLKGGGASDPKNPDLYYWTYFPKVIVCIFRVCRKIFRVHPSLVYSYLFRIRLTCAEAITRTASSDKETLKSSTRGSWGVNVVEGTESEARDTRPILRSL